MRQTRSVAENHYLEELSNNLKLDEEIDDKSELFHDWPSWFTTNIRWLAINGEIINVTSDSCVNSNWL